MKIKMSKAALVEALEKQLAVAKKADDANRKKHEADETIALKKFRDKLSRASRMSYSELKKLKSEHKLDLYFESPSCPRLEATQFERAIHRLNLDTRKELVLDYELEQLLWWSKEPRKQTVCD